MVCSFLATSPTVRGAEWRAPVYSRTQGVPQCCARRRPAVNTIDPIPRRFASGDWAGCSPIEIAGSGRVYGWLGRSPRGIVRDCGCGSSTELRHRFARLIGARPSEVTIANIAAYGLHVVANGLDLREGDEVVVATNDFPSDLLPWLRLENRGVVAPIPARPSGDPLPHSTGCDCGC